MHVNLKTGTLNIKNDPELDALVSFGSRMNKKRGFLFVSKVLGKHLPTKPSVMNKIYQKLASLIPEHHTPTLFVGFAETATALGQGVYEAANLPDSFYIHSTRFQTSQPTFFSFFETHCHAPSHIFYEPKDAVLLQKLQHIKRVILIDDEVSTGSTANNLVMQFKDHLPNVEKYFLLTILNWSEKNYKNFKYLSLYQGRFDFTPIEMTMPENIISEPEHVENLDTIIPYNFGRYGTQKLNLFFSVDTLSLKDKKVLVLGTAEFMYAPYLFAEYLERSGIDVYFQATTRSPVNVDGAVTSILHFKDNYFEEIDNFLYNVIDRNYDKVFICYETTKLPESYTLKTQLEPYFEVEELFFSENGVQDV